MEKKAKKDYQTHVMTERTHLSQVRRAFTKSLDGSHIDPGLINFYVTCCHYLNYSQFFRASTPRLQDGYMPETPRSQRHKEARACHTKGPQKP